MKLQEAAHKVAAEFEFPPSAVRAAVDEFLREMGTCWVQIYSINSSLPSRPPMSSHQDAC